MFGNREDSGERQPLLNSIPVTTSLPVENSVIGDVFPLNTRSNSYICEKRSGSFSQSLQSLRHGSIANVTSAGFLSVFGPGLVVMLADTDAGCLITAAQTGATWGYSLIWLQAVLIPFLFMSQELAVRLGIFTGLGHGELIKKHFGSAWAWLSVITLVVTCTGAVVSEISGIVGVGRLLHIPDAVSAFSTAAILIFIVVKGKYREVEIAALVMGMFEFTYFITMVLSFRWSDFKDSLFHFPIYNSGYCFLVAANIGAVIMPWMIFYQQSAVVDKELSPFQLKYARQDTVIGAFLTQLIMSAVIITTAGTIWHGAGRQYPNPNPPSEIGQFSRGISKHIYGWVGDALFCMGMIGGALVGAVVVSLTAAWGLGEVAGYKHSLSASLQEAPWFYAVFGGCICCGVISSLYIHNLVLLNVCIQVMNALLLPIVLGFLYVLAVWYLPEHARLKGWYMYFSGIAYFLISAIAVSGGIYGAVDLYRSA